MPKSDPNQVAYDIEEIGALPSEFLENLRADAEEPRQLRAAAADLDSKPVDGETE